MAADLPLDTGTARGVLLPLRPPPFWLTPVGPRRRVAAGVGLTATHLVLTQHARPVPVRWDQVRRIGSPSVRWGTGPAPEPGADLVAIVVSDETLLAYLPAAARRVGLRALRRTGEVTIATIPAAAWAMDPAAAYAALRCYLDRPDLRAELAGEAALRRIGRAAPTGGPAGAGPRPGG